MPFLSDLAAAVRYGFAGLPIVPRMKFCALRTVLVLASILIPIALDPDRVSLAALRPGFAEYDDEYATLLERFATLRAAGFRFYFRLCAPT